MVRHRKAGAMRYLTAGLAGVILVCGITAIAGGTERCGRNLVSIGDTTGEVLSKCGEPFYRDQVATQSVGVPKGMDLGSSVTTFVELWAYHEGPRTLLRIFRFEAGRLAAIEHGNRAGKTPHKSSAFIVQLGDFLPQVLIKYGEPLAWEVIGFQSRQLESEGTHTGSRTVTQVDEKIERLTYDMGSRKFQKILTFIGGRLAKVEDGERN